MRNLISKILFVSALLVSQTLHASGLMVTPSRLEFKGKTESQEVKLINKSNETVTYRVTLQHLRMNEKGEYQEIDETKKFDEKFADNLLRFSPRKITLKPNEVQTIRIALNKADTSGNGEYRSHLLFREEPAADFKQANNVEPSKAKDDKKISIVLKPLFGISIPVIVNKGEVSATGTLDNLAVKSDDKDKSKKFLSIDVQRSGDASLYGNFVVKFKDAAGKEHDAGILNAVSVFAPYAKRNVMIPLNLPKGVNLANGSLSVKYLTKSDNAKEDKQVIAQGMLAVK